MNWKTIHHLPRVRRILIGIIGIVLLLVVFKLGELYGYHRAGFGRRFGDNFHRNFIGPDGRGGPFMGEGIPSGHGAVGKVVSVALPKITLTGPDNIEKVIVTTNDTIVHQYHNAAAVADIKAGDNILVLGDPNASGEIVARLIRIIPPAPTQPAAPQSTNQQ